MSETSLQERRRPAGMTAAWRPGRRRAATADGAQAHADPYAGGTPALLQLEGAEAAAAQGW